MMQSVRFLARYKPWWMTLAVAASLGVTRLATAHPGHGVTADGDSAAHYLIEPSHGISLSIVVGLAACAIIVIWRRWPHRVDASRVDLS